MSSAHEGTVLIRRIVTYHSLCIRKTSGLEADYAYRLGTYVVLEQIPQWWKRRGKTESIWDVPEGFAHTTKEEWDLLRFTNTRRAKEGLPLFVPFIIMQNMEGVRAGEPM